MVETASKGRRVTDTNNNEIWEKVYHTDARVTAMESQLSDLNNSMGRIESLLLNRQTSPMSIVGIMLTALTFLGGLLFGMSQFTHLTLLPISDDVAEHRVAIDRFSEYKEEMGYKLGALEEWQVSTIADIDRIREGIEESCNR